MLDSFLSHHSVYKTSSHHHHQQQQQQQYAPILPFSLTSCHKFADDWMILAFVHTVLWLHWKHERDLAKRACSFPQTSGMSIWLLNNSTKLYLFMNLNTILCWWHKMTFLIPSCTVTSHNQQCTWEILRFACESNLQNFAWLTAYLSAMNLIQCHGRFFEKCLKTRRNKWPFFDFWIPTVAMDSGVLRTAEQFINI